MQVYRKDNGAVVGEGDLIKDFLGDVRRFRRIVRESGPSTVGLIELFGGRVANPETFGVEIRD